MKGRIPDLIVNFGKFPCSWIRIRVPNADSDPVAEYIDSEIGDKVNSCIGLAYRLTRHVAWRAGTTKPYAGVDFIHQSGIYEFGYRKAISMPIHADPSPQHWYNHAKSVQNL